MSPVAYSIDFAANAAGMTVAAFFASRLAGRTSTRRIILIGQIAALTAGMVMLVGAVALDTPLLLAIICFFVMMSAQGLIGPNGGALASAEVPDHPGTGSALLGCVQWVAAGVIPPIAGLGGATTAVPMAILMTAGAAASMAGLPYSPDPAPGYNTDAFCSTGRRAAGRQNRCSTKPVQVLVGGFVRGGDGSGDR